MRTLFDDPPELVKPAAGLTLADRLPPRDYQAEAVGSFRGHYAAGCRHMLFRLATGCGKTYTAALAIEEWLAVGPHRRAMVLAYERGLVNQFREELIDFLPGVDVGLEMSTDGTVDQTRIPPVVVASRQTLYLDEDERSRLFKFDPLAFEWLIVPDECHGWKYGLPSCRHIVDWFERNPASAWLGLTATPERGDGVSLARLFGTVCCELRLSDAIEAGYLVPLRQKFIVVEGLDFKNLHEVAGDFDEGELDAILSEREQLLAMAAPLLDHVEDRRTLVFCPGVACARALARTINAEIDLRGLPHGRAESMDGSTPEAVRQDIIGRHQAGAFQFLVVCALCRAGYNDPGLGAVAVFRPTKSRVMAEQMKGRGIRPLRGTINGLATAEERRAAIAASAKPDCLIIDLVGVSGLPEVASTAHLLASGEPDEVIERANKRIADGAEETVEEAVKKAKSEIAEEREAARREREERERREREEALRRARLEADVRYTARDVAGVADGGAHTDVDRMVERATPGQVRLLVALGWPEDEARRLSKRQAGAAIGDGRRRQPRAEQASKPPLKQLVSGPPSPNQIRVLQRFGRSVPSTFGEAAILIGGINQELAKR